jgi:hypothetical protein
MTDHIATSLTDHLAGSVAGLAILDHIIAKTAEPEKRDILALLKSDIEQDKEVLQRLIDDMNISESTFRKASAWVSEKLVEVKLRFDDPSAGPFVVFESLEALSLGIEGKRSLWRALSRIPTGETPIASLDLDALTKRAEDQREVVETFRLSTAIEAFASGDASSGV